MFLLHLRNGRRGAACHQSSWRCLPTSQHDAAPLCGGVHVEVVNGLRMGRLASLQKPEATTPFQSSFSTRVGCECVAHVSHAFTDFTYCATVLSIAGVGSFDSASTAAMLRKLMNVVGGEASGSCCVALWEERIHIYTYIYPLKYVLEDESGRCSAHTCCSHVALQEELCQHAWISPNQGKTQL